MNHYKLEGRKIVPCSLMAWAEWLSLEEGRIARTQIGQFDISTIFLGLDHGFDADKQPILWETMVFEPDPTNEICGRREVTGDRCAGSFEQAEAMHGRMVAKMEAKA